MVKGLLDRGAAVDVFAAAALGKMDVVRKQASFRRSARSISAWSTLPKSSCSSFRHETISAMCWSETVVIDCSPISLSPPGDERPRRTGVKGGFSCSFSLTAGRPGPIGGAGIAFPFFGTAPFPEEE